MSERIEKSAEVQVAKVSDEGVVYGFAIVSKEGGEEHYDTQGDHIPEDVMRSASTEFMSNERTMKEMHMGLIKGRVLHSLPLTGELAEGLDIQTEKTGWIIGVKPSDDATLQKFRSGELTGFSIGGLGSFEEAA